MCPPALFSPSRLPGAVFDRQASIRRSLINTDTVSRRPKKVKRRKTISGLPDNINLELGMDHRGDTCCPLLSTDLYQHCGQASLLPFCAARNLVLLDLCFYITTYNEKLGYTERDKETHASSQCWIKSLQLLQLISTSSRVLIHSPPPVYPQPRTSHEIIFFIFVFYPFLLLLLLKLLT